MSVVVKVGQWQKALIATGVTRQRLGAAITKSVLQDAAFLRKQIVQGIRRQAPAGKKFRQLAPTTIAVRRFRGFRGSKALIVRADLINSIQVKKLRGAAFIGVLKQKRSPDGRSLADIARVQEFGSKTIVIEMTDKMRRFLFAAFASGAGTAGGGGGGGGGTGIIILRIPPRPFLRPVFKKFAKPSVMRPRILNRLALNMGGVIGTPSSIPPR